MEDRSQSIPILFETPYRGQKLASPDSVVAAIASMPRHARDQLPMVVVSQVHTWDVGGADTGVVYLFTSGNAGDVDDLRTTLVHEAGHLFGIKTFGLEPDGLPWKPWRRAVLRDWFCATYDSVRTILKRGDYQDDFADTYLTYLAVRGTSNESAYRPVLRYRFSLFDRLIPKSLQSPMSGAP